MTIQRQLTTQGNILISYLTSASPER